VTGTQVDTQLAGDQTDLVKGNTYTWTRYVNVPAADIWTFVLSGPQAPWWGTRPGLNGGVNPVSGPASGAIARTSAERWSRQRTRLVLSFPPCQDPSAGGRLTRGDRCPDPGRR